MGLPERRALIHRIEQLRQSTAHSAAHLTTLRPGVNSQMAEDVVRVFVDHLLSLPIPSSPRKLDLFLCSNGGQSTVPWRLIPLFREFASSFCVLIPFHAL